MDEFSIISNEISNLIKNNADDKLITEKYIELKNYVESNYHKCESYYQILVTINIEIAKRAIIYDKELAKKHLDLVTPILKYGDNHNKYDYYTFYSLLDDQKMVYYLKKALKYSDDYEAFDVYDALFEHSLNNDELNDIVKYGTKALDYCYKLGYDEKIENIALCIGLSLIHLESYKRSLKYLFIALDNLNEYAKDYNENIYRIYDNIAYDYEHLEKYSKAMHFNIIALEYAKKLNEENIVKTLISIVETADANENFSVELTYLKKLNKYLDGERLFINKCRIFSVELKLSSFDVLKRRIKQLSIDYNDCINDNTRLHYAIACVSYYRYLFDYDYNTDFTWLKKGIEIYESIENPTPDSNWFLIKSYCLYGNNLIYGDEKRKKYKIGLELFEKNVNQFIDFDCFDIYQTYLNYIDVLKRFEEGIKVVDSLINVLNLINPPDKKYFIASGYYHLSDLTEGDAQKCINYHEKAIDILKDSVKTPELELLFEINSSLSYFYEVIDEIDLAIETVKKNIDIAKKLDDFYISDAYNQLAYYYDALGDYKKEKEIFEEEIDILSEYPNNQVFIADVYSKYASLLNYDLNDNYLAIKYYDMAIKIFKNHNKNAELAEKIADQHFGLANAYWELNDGEETLKNYFKSLECLDEAKKHQHFYNKQHYAIVLRSIAFTYNQLEKISKADEYYKKTIEYAENLFKEDLSMNDLLISIYQSAVDFYKKTMDYDMQKQLEDKLEALNEKEEIVS